MSLTHEDLEKAYQEAWAGGHLEPEVGMIRCEVCRKSFGLIRGHKNEVCEHLQKLFDERRKP